MDVYLFRICTLILFFLQQTNNEYTTQIIKHNFYTQTASHQRRVACDFTPPLAQFFKHFVDIIIFNNILYYFISIFFFYLTWFCPYPKILSVTTSSIYRPSLLLWIMFLEYRSPVHYVIPCQKAFVKPPIINSVHIGFGYPFPNVIRIPLPLNHPIFSNWQLNKHLR